MATTRPDTVGPTPSVNSPTLTTYFLSKRLGSPSSASVVKHDEKKIKNSNIPTAETLFLDDSIAFCYDYIDKTLSPAMPFDQKNETKIHTSTIVPPLDSGYDDDSIAEYNKLYLKKMLGTDSDSDSGPTSDTEEETPILKDTNYLFSFSDIQSSNDPSFNAVNDQPFCNVPLALFTAPLPSGNIAARKTVQTNPVFIKIFSDEKEQDKRLIKDRKKEAIKRAKEVLKYATAGALTGGSLSFIITFTIAELIALGIYRDTVCTFDYSAGEKYHCKVVSCSNGLANLYCTSKFEINYASLARKGFVAGRQAHSDWWGVTGEALMMVAMSGSILVGGMCGGIYGFFKRIPTTEEMATEAELERRHIERVPYYYYIEPWPPWLNEGFQKCKKWVSGAPTLFQKMKCPSLGNTVSYLQTLLGPRKR